VPKALGAVSITLWYPCGSPLPPAAAIFYGNLRQPANSSAALAPGSRAVIRPGGDL